MKILPIVSWLFGLAIFIAGIMNIMLVHLVPGAVYLLLSLLYIPPVNAILRAKYGFSFPGVIKVILGLILIIFTFGVSDLGDWIDKM